MKNFGASDWCMIILALSVLLSIVIIPVMRIATGDPLSDNASGFLNTFITGVGVGLLAIISGKKDKNDKPE